MKIAYDGIDFVTLNETNWFDTPKSKRHLIKLDFQNPNTKTLDEILALNNKTNRFVVDNHVRFYNQYFRDNHVEKKYYVENRQDDCLITFFRKNNKVMFNLCNLSPYNYEYIYPDMLFDVLRNVEVIMMKKEWFDPVRNVMSGWSGNVVLKDSVCN